MPDNIAHILTLGGTIIAVLLVYLQIQKGQQSTLRLQEEHLKNELRVQIHERISDSVDRAREAIGRAESDGRRLVWMIRDHNLHPISSRRPDLSAAITVQHMASKSITELASIIERYEIAFPGFRQISEALLKGGERVRDTWNPLFVELIQLLPTVTEGQGGENVWSGPLRKATNEDVENLEAMLRDYEEAIFDLYAFSMDIMIESQNVLLGRLFARRVPARQPQDPSLPVLAPTTYDT